MLNNIVCSICCMFAQDEHLTHMFSLQDKMDCLSASHPSTSSDSMEMPQKKIDDRLPQKNIDIVSTAKPTALEHCSSVEQKRDSKLVKNAELFNAYVTKAKWTSADKAAWQQTDALALECSGSSWRFRGRPKPSTKGPDSSDSSCTEIGKVVHGECALTKRNVARMSMKKIVNEEDPLPAGFMQSSTAGYDNAAATETDPEVKVVDQVRLPARFKCAVKRPRAKCPLCGCKMENTAHRVRVAAQLDEAYQRCGLCGADEYSFCTSCFIPWTCEIASLAAATEDIYLKPYVNASHVCCCCIAAVPRMTAQDALGTEKPRMTSMTHQQWDHINAVFKYVDEYGFPPVEIVSCRKLEVKLPAADHGHASSKASTVSREASTVSREDSWTVL